MFFDNCFCGKLPEICLLLHAVFYSILLESVKARDLTRPGPRSGELRRASVWFDQVVVAGSQSPAKKKERGLR